MIRLIIYSIIQSMLLSGGQVLLKLALNRMEPFGWNWKWFHDLFTNWYFMGCGICYGLGSVLWMYIIKHFPFSMAYPMISLSYVFGMFAAMIFFNEQIPLTRWIGVFLIISGCCLIAK
ncbi:MAG: EamA family transporter [Bacteroidales bacterium]|nr:EamA family transporter [Bacteroidales bacterium]